MLHRIPEGDGVLEGIKFLGEKAPRDEALHFILKEKP
jgi:hypothetical protein